MAKKNISHLLGGLLSEDSLTKKANNNSGSATVKNPVSESESGVTGMNYDNSEARTTLVVPSKIMRQVKYIAMVDDVKIKEVLSAALRNYIAYWENTNGKINLS